MTQRDLRELVAGIAVRQEHLFERAERLFETVGRQGEDTDRRLKENALRMKETEIFIQELGKQIGKLGEKFGGFTEGMALPSMQKVLEARFGMNVITPRVRVRKGGRTMELDVLAYSNLPESDAVYIVEIKSHLREDGLQQMLRILREFRGFFPEHAEKKIYGILAAVDLSPKMRDKVLREGIYLACIHDEEFGLQVPQDFQPRAF